MYHLFQNKDHKTAKNATLMEVTVVNIQTMELESNSSYHLKKKFIMFTAIEILSFLIKGQVNY